MNKITLKDGTVVTTKGGLLYANGTYIDLPHADAVAYECGFIYAERLVKALEKGEIGEPE